MRLYRIIRPVNNIDRDQRFYAALTGDAGERVSPGRHYFDLGGAILALYDPIADGDEALGADFRPHPNQYIYLSTLDLESAVRRALDAGAPESPEGIRTMPWGERLYYTSDPSGNPVCLVDRDTVFLGTPAPSGQDDS